MCQCLLNLTLNNRNYWNVTRNCYYDLLLNMNLISNLGKFRAIRLWVWPSKVSFTAIALTKEEFQRRFRNILDFNHLFFQALFKIWVTINWSYESHLYFIFSTILKYTNMPSLTKCFEKMVAATLKKNLGHSMLKHNDNSCLQEDQEP